VVSGPELRKRESAVLAACAAQVLSRPFADITAKSVAEASGLPQWAAYGAINRLARSREHLIRRAVLHVAGGLAADIAKAGAPGATVLGTLAAFLEEAARVVKSKDFQRFYRVVLCEGAFHPWLHPLYEEKVAAIFCRRLETLARAAGDRAGVAVFFRHGAARDVLRGLESALVLPALLPGRHAPPADEAAMLRDLARQAFARSHAWEVGEAA
jgi:hypothetical protein